MTLPIPPLPADVHAARARITPHIVRTPMLRNAALDALTGGKILVKAEVLQRTGSFKLRGATNALLRLTPQQLERGVVAYSSGNHAQAIACAAQRFGTSATIVMPADAPEIKRQHTAFWGADIIPYNRASENREAIAARICAQTGAVLIPPYEHPDVIAGQGTLALELAEDAAAAGLSLDAMIVCTGGGGLVAGCALALCDVSPNTKVYSAEPADLDDTARSRALGYRVANTMQGSHYCDAILTPIPGELTFSINKRLLTAGLTATDEAVQAAVQFAHRHLKLVVEPGGAVALAALMSSYHARGQVVGIVLSGGNAD